MPKAVNELEETLLDIECFMKNTQMTYLNEEFETRPVTSNILVSGEPATFIEQTAKFLERKDDVSPRMKYFEAKQTTVEETLTQEILESTYRKASTKDCYAC